MLNALLFSLICTALMLYLVAVYITNDREIDRDEIRRQEREKHRRELDYWKNEACKSRTVIKVMDGETFSLENRR